MIQKCRVISPILMTLYVSGSVIQRRVINPFCRRCRSRGLRHRGWGCGHHLRADAVDHRERPCRVRLLRHVSQLQPRTPAIHTRGRHKRPSPPGKVVASCDGKPTVTCYHSYGVVKVLVISEVFIRPKTTAACDAVL